MNENDVSIIIVSYNSLSLTKKCIDSIFRFTKDLNFEVIVVDNNSKDGSKSYLRTDVRIKLIESNKNLGFGKGCNLGIEKASNSRYYFFFNSDAFLVDNSIKDLKDFMDSRPDLMVAGGLLYSENGDLRNSYANFYSFAHFIKGSIWKYFYSKDYYDVERKPLPDVKGFPFEVDYISGADLFVRKQAIDALGAFNSSFFMYSEDTELCLRIEKYFKVKSYVYPNAKFFHKGQGSNKKGLNSVKFRFIKLHSKATYYRLTMGIKEFIMVYITGIIRILKV